MTDPNVVLKFMTAEEMISETLNPDIEDRDGLAHDLLNEFFRGYPIENLKLLINSEHLSARGTASFIATELGKLAAPLLEDIASLLSHPTPRARYDALETLWKCATYKDGWAIAAVLRHLEDPWPGVRTGAIDAIRLANREALLSGFKHLRIERPKSVYAKFGRAFVRESLNNHIIFCVIACFKLIWRFLWFSVVLHLWIMPIRRNAQSGISF